MLPRPPDARCRTGWGVAGRAGRSRRLEPVAGRRRAEGPPGGWPIRPYATAADTLRARRKPSPKLTICRLASS